MSNVLDVQNEWEENTHNTQHRLLVDVPAGVTQEEGYTGLFLPPSFCGACLNFFSREKDVSRSFPLSTMKKPNFVY